MNGTALAVGFGAGILLLLATSLLWSLLIFVAWNSLVPSTFGLPAIDFFQAVAAYVLILLARSIVTK